MDDRAKEKIRELMDAAHEGDGVTSGWLEKAADELRDFFRRDDLDEEELLLVDEHGGPSGLSAPRWLCHAIGLRQGPVHGLLWGPDDPPRMLLQLRSWTKKEFPHHLELTATGHTGTSRDWKAAAYRELAEETGIRPDDLVDDLIFAGVNLQTYDDDLTCFHDREFVRIYTQRLNKSGTKSIRTNESEVEKVMFLDQEEISDLAMRGFKFAPGIKMTLPVYAEWLRKNLTLLFP